MATELRDEIWRIHLLRPATIMPCYITYQRTVRQRRTVGGFWTEQEKYRQYMYQVGFCLLPILLLTIVVRIWAPFE